MKRTLRRGLIILLALVFAGSLGMVIYRGIEYKEGQETYEEAAELVQLPDLSDLPEPTPEEPEESAPVYVDPYADALRNMDFAALQEVNSDVLGWILIPNTVISYPLVQGKQQSVLSQSHLEKVDQRGGRDFPGMSEQPGLQRFQYRDLRTPDE